jgi:RimJ/RimL family protein N-acetyltransferase
MLTFDKDLVGQWVARHTSSTFTPENSSCIGLLDKDGQLIAGVWYESYNKVSIMAHIAIQGRINREFLFTIFDYPFVQLGVNKIIGPVNSNNLDALKLDDNFGFEEEARIKDAYPDGDMVLLSLTKDKCRFLGEKYGKRRR